MKFSYLKMNCIRSKPVYIMSEKRITIRDIAKKNGYSKTAVSFASILVEVQ